MRQQVVSHPRKEDEEMVQVEVPPDVAEYLSDPVVVAHMAKEARKVKAAEEKKAKAARDKAWAESELRKLIDQEREAKKAAAAAAEANAAKMVEIRKARFQEVFEAVWPLRGEAVADSNLVQWECVWEAAEEPMLARGSVEMKPPKKGRWPGQDVMIFVDRLPPPKSDLEKMADPDPKLRIRLAYKADRFGGHRRYSKETREIEELKAVRGRSARALYDGTWLEGHRLFTEASNATRAYVAAQRIPLINTIERQVAAAEAEIKAMEEHRASLPVPLGTYIGPKTKEESA